MKNASLKYPFVLLCLLFFTRADAQSISILQQGKPASIRGLSVVDDSVAWVSGSHGYIALTNNGGKTWNWQQIKGYEKSDFRDIEAFSGKEAIIMSSGTPALILKTIDGGKSWQEKYRNADTSYFLDAMDFANAKHGLVLGDPIKNKFVLLETTDGGETWKSFKNPPDALPAEAAFAASGTCLRVSKLISIVTGGSNSRILFSPLGHTAWTSAPLPFTNGKQSRGAFSMAFGDRQTIIVGGDYAADKKSDSVAYLMPEANASYQNNLPQKGPEGYQSCVEYLSNDIFLATGTPGSNITTDGGKTWIKIDNNSFNVCRKAKHGKLVLLAGDKGKIGALQL